MCNSTKCKIMLRNLQKSIDKVIFPVYNRIKAKRLWSVYSPKKTRFMASLYFIYSYLGK